MNKHWLKNFLQFSSAIGQMTRLVWQAQPVVFIGVILIQVAQGFFPVLAAWFTKQIFDLLAQVLTGNMSNRFLQDLWPLLAMQAAITVGGQISEAWNGYLHAELGRQLKLKAEALIYQQIARLDGLAYFEDPKFHDTIRLATQGVHSGPSQIIDVAANLLRSLITLISFLGILFFVGPMLAVVIGIASLPQLILQLKFGRQRFDLMYQNSPRERRAFYLAQVLSSVGFVKEVRLFNLADYFLGQFLETNREVQQAQRAQQLGEMRWQFALGLLSTLVNGGAFIVVILQAFSGRISLGDVSLYTSALGSVQGALVGIFGTFSTLNESALFFTHFTKLMALPPALPVMNPAQQISSLRLGIELRNVSFRYSEQHPWILQNVNLFIPRGKCLALVGMNGAGKTTLVKLLTRLYDPTEGQILWDGVDLRAFEPTELRQRMGAIFQDFARYDLTVQENIGLGNVADVNNSERIRQAAREVGIHEWLQKLPRGYQTVLSRWLVEDEQGVDLSGGQWQKVATARMFMREADFLILDEPTASLDAQAEHEIYHHFVDLTSGRTSLLISHRFSTVRMADLIAVLENARITEYGSHEELLSHDGTYTRLYNMQAEQFGHAPVPI